MPFGVTNVPKTFMDLLNMVFQSDLINFPVSSLKNLGIFKNESEHMDHLRVVIQVRKY